jgi:hypothetical protein
MSYCVQADIENVFGKDNVAVWSRLDDTEGADTTRIASAIIIATTLIEAQFRDSFYLVPLVPLDAGTTSLIANWTAIGAGIWLFNNRPGYKNYEDDDVKGFAQIKRGAEKQILDVLSGKMRLNCGKAQTIRGGGPFVVIDRETFDVFPFAHT